MCARRPDSRSARQAPRPTFWPPGVKTDSRFCSSGDQTRVLLAGRPGLRSGRRRAERTSRFCRATRLEFWSPGAQPLRSGRRARRTDVPFLLAGRGRPDSRSGRRAPRVTFWSPGDQTRVLLAGRPGLRSCRRASRMDVPFLLAGRADSRSARRPSRLAFCSPGDQTRVLLAEQPDLRSAHRATRLTFYSPGCWSFGEYGQFFV
ncbi:hypothetical protein Rs2_35660 [Raphanus sativus]|nr:hypothetical protein Rs2_35660 [Raphanus sativus]